MKNLFFIISLLFSTYAYGQIKIMDTKVQDPKDDNFVVYDSMKNMRTEEYIDAYRYLIGQTLMYCGDPYHDTKSNIKVGNYYRVDTILPDKPLKSLYNILSLTDIDTGEKMQEAAGYRNECNFKWVVLGHYEKMKSLYVNKEFVYIDNDKYGIYDKKRDSLINLETDIATKNIATGSVWTCVDIQVKPREKGDNMNTDLGSPIVLIFSNPKYGKHYYYLEDQSGHQYRNIYKEGMPVECGKFRLKSYYDKAKALNIAARNKRKADLTRKYGVSAANLILQGKVTIGMSKEMCIEAWGKPKYVNKTTRSQGIHEQWVYRSGNYLYFDNGKLTSIQN